MYPRESRCTSGKQVHPKKAGTPWERRCTPRKEGVPWKNSQAQSMSGFREHQEPLSVPPIPTPLAAERSVGGGMVPPANLCTLTLNKDRRDSYSPAVPRVAWTCSLWLWLVASFPASLWTSPGSTGATTLEASLKQRRGLGSCWPSLTLLQPLLLALVNSCPAQGSQVWDLFLLLKTQEVSLGYQPVL